ncbi:MAG: carbon-nitrogen hydrolase family protein [Pseudomonadota bacterium]
MPKIAIAALQLELSADDNVERLCDEVRAVRKRFPWVHLVTFGELAAFGPDPRKAQPLPGPAEDAFRSVARETGLWLIPGSLYEKADGVVFNTAPVIDPSGEVVARCRKLFPFLPYEKGVTGGEEFCTFDIDGVGRFGVSICYDMWFPETTRSLAHLGAEAIIHPTLTNTIDRDVELSIARTNAACNQVYFVDVNSAGRLAFGRSIVVGPGGEIIHEAGTGREIIVTELDLDHARRVRERGWQGLGQPLKSFRDAALRYPAYRQDTADSAFSALGSLKTPERE